MKRSILLGSLSAAALAAIAPAPATATTPTYINGGGATASQGDYAGPNSSSGAATSEMSVYNSGSSAVQWGTYWGSGATGQTAFLNNDLTCDINKVKKINNSLCSNTPGGVNAVHYANSDAVLTSAGTDQWASSSWGQSAAGNLIQIPTLGTGVALVVNDTNITANNQVQLSNNDVCEIFSGGYSDFSQITDSPTAPAAGPITLVYRSDTSGTTFILSEYLANNCNSSNTQAGVTFAPTTTFASLFPSPGITAYVAHSSGQSGSSGVGNYLAGLSASGAVPQAIGYITPDWTSVAPNPDTFLSNGARSELVVAGVVNGGTSYIPSATGILKGLESVTQVAQGSPLTPPTSATAAANPVNWVPVPQVVSAGYPIVGYGTFDLAQCYASTGIADGIKAFLKDHYTNSAYATIQANNGLLAVVKTKAAKFETAVLKNILANSNKWNVDIQDKTACKGKAGR